MQARMLVTTTTVCTLEHVQDTMTEVDAMCSLAKRQGITIVLVIGTYF